MTFRTEIKIPKANQLIDYQSNILSLGSCFADRIGERLSNRKFSTLVNPLGIFYNPLSIANVLHKSLQQTNITSNFASHLEEWHSFELHGKFNHSDQSIFSENVSNLLAKLRNQISHTDCLILTFGTAYVFRKKDTGEVVANCHKYSGDLFNRELLSVEEITSNLDSLFSILKNQNPKLQIILTVSPIRHIRDGLSQNSLSKATLRLACEQLSQNQDCVTYFPSYEIMMDDLRDYRFYKDDFIHPTTFAEDYIWEKFVETFMNEGTIDLMNRWEKLLSEMNHRPLKPESEAYQKFLKALLRKLETISKEIDCKKEIEEIKKIHIN